MKKTNALAYIRQLCCLGLGREILIPELLRAIQSVVPSASNVFVGLGEDYCPRYVITEFYVPEVVDYYVNNISRLHDGGVMSRLKRWHDMYGVLDTPDIIVDRFYRCEYYHEIWRPCEQHHFLQGKVSQNQCVFGILMLFRSRDVSPFSAEDKRLFECLLPYVAHALGTSQDVTDYSGPAESGMFIMNREGNLAFADEKARRLLSMAKYPRYPVCRTEIRNVTVPPRVKQLCRNLDSIFRGGDTPPPTLIEENARGRFVFSAHWLDSMNPGGDGMIGIAVEYHEPMALRLWRGLKDLPLSPTQREVCLLLAQNHTQVTIAQRLGIRITTAKDHVRTVYGKLDINRREQLIERLMTITNIQAQR